MKFIAVSKKVVSQAFHASLFAAREQILTDCNYFCREDQGILIDSAETSVSNDVLTITWNTPYAKKMYYTGIPSKAMNPNASLQWADRGKQEFGKDWIRILEKGMEENL